MSSLLHEYDAVKRREYYLRNRKLKGRSKKETTAVVKQAPAKKTYAQRQKELEARVNRLKARLAQLQVVLKAMTEAAQKRSGIGKNTAEKSAVAKYQSKQAADPTSKYEKKTQSEKNAAAKASAKYRDKNEGLTSQVTDLNNKIKAIRDRIKRLQQTGSVGASTSTTR